MKYNKNAKFKCLNSNCKKVGNTIILKRSVKSTPKCKYCHANMAVKTLGYSVDYT